MGASSWLFELDQTRLDYVVLLTLALLTLAAGLLLRVGLVAWVLRLLGRIVRGGIHRGFQLWERLLSWASWPLFLALALSLLLAGRAVVAYLPLLTVASALAVIFMGVVACLAYMFIDLERYQVERGRMALP